MATNSSKKRRGATKKNQPSSVANNKSQKPSIWLIATTILSIIILVIFLMQLEPGKSSTQAHKPAKPVKSTSKPNKPLPVIKSEEPKKVEDYDFYTILPKNNYGLDSLGNNDLSKLDEKRAQAALRGEIPPPLPQIVEKKLPAQVNNLANTNTVKQTEPVIKETTKETAKLTVKKEEPRKAINSKTAKDEQNKEKNIDNSIYYFWQIGSFKNKQEADVMRARLAVLGHIARIETVSVKGETWYRVLAGPYLDKAKLITVQQQLTKQGFNNLLLQQRQSK